jgi:hypothetical protein
MCMKSDQNIFTHHITDILVFVLCKIPALVNRITNAILNDGESVFVLVLVQVEMEDDSKKKFLNTSRLSLTHFSDF